MLQGVEDDSQGAQRLNLSVSYHIKSNSEGHIFQEKGAFETLVGLVDIANKNMEHQLNLNFKTRSTFFHISMSHMPTCNILTHTQIIFLFTWN